jgi:hypothetical protein
MPANAYTLVPYTYDTITGTGAGTSRGGTNNNGFIFPAGIYYIELSMTIEPETRSGLTGGSNTGSSNEYLQLGLYEGNPGTQIALFETNQMMGNNLSMNLIPSGCTSCGIFNIPSQTTYYIYAYPFTYAAVPYTIGFSCLTINKLG